MPRLPWVVASASLIAHSLLAAGDAGSPCPLQSPDGGYTSFMAWTAIFNAQPHHVASPFRHNLVPPVMLPSICSEDVWSSDNWKYLGMRGSDWMATPSTYPANFVVGSEDCSQSLTGVGVFTAIQSHGALRLHFAGCDKPDTIFALRLENDTRPSTGTGEPPVMGLKLLDFMCAVAPEECKAAKGRVAHTGSVEVGGLQLAKGKVGVGKCKGYGVEPHTVSPAPTSASGCAGQCQERIAQNLADPSQGSCRGYAWSEHLQSCIVYDGWPVTGTDDSWSTEGYFCDNMTAVAAMAPAPAPAADARPVVTLDLSKIFEDPRAVTARRMQVSPFTMGCFQNFDWYIIDRWVNIPLDEYAVLMEMTTTNITADEYMLSHPSHGGYAPRANLIVERACVRDCSGALRAECQSEADMAGPPPGYGVTLDGRFVPKQGAASSPLDASTVAGSVMGNAAAETFMDSKSLPWAILAAFFTAVGGFVVTFVIGGVFRKYVVSRPKYHTVEEVKLIYEGEEEETLALRSSPDGNMQSYMGSAGGISNTWTPSKAKPTMSNGFGARILAPFSTQ